MEMNKIALSDSCSSYTFYELEMLLPSLSIWLTDSARNGEIALQIRDQMSMALSILAGCQTDLTIFLLHYDSPKIKMDLLKKRGVPIINSLPQLSNEMESVRGNGRAHFVFSTSNTTSATSQWVKLPLNAIITKSKMLIQMLGLTSHDCTYIISPFCFIQTFWTLVSHLLANATVVIDRFNSNRLAERLAAGEVTTLITVPSIARTIANTVNNIGSLRLLVLGGDYADGTLIDNLANRWPNLLFANVYGCTETAAADLVLHPTPLAKRTPELYSIGKPTFYSKVTIRGIEDDAKQACGEPGLIWIESPFICKQYIDSDQILVDLEKGFCTGDIGYYDESGCIYYLGRRTGIVKTNGNKISVLEVENALLKHPQISEAVAFGLPHPLYGQILICEIVTDGATSKKDIEMFLMSYIEKYKLPRRYYIIDSLPRTISGKIIRNIERLKEGMHNELI